MTEIRSQENAIVLAAAQNLISLGSIGAQLLLEGKESEEQIEKGINLLTVFTAYSKKADLEDVEIDALLYCLKSQSEDDYFPTTNPIVGKELTTVVQVISGFGKIVGTVILVGDWNASGDQFPNGGGTGISGAIEKGNEFNIAVGGILGGVDVGTGATIRALVDSPGQILANWRIYY